MSLQSFREDLNKKESENESKRENIIKKIKEIIHIEEVTQIFNDLSGFIRKDITAKLDNKTTLKITPLYGDTKVSIIKKSVVKKEETIIFEKFKSKYSRPPQSHALKISELSEFYHKLEPYKEIIEDKIEEEIRKQFEFDKLIKKEG